METFPKLQSTKQVANHLNLNIETAAPQRRSLRVEDSKANVESPAFEIYDMEKLK